LSASGRLNPLLASAHRRQVQMLGTFHIAESCRKSVCGGGACCLEGAVRGRGCLAEAVVFQLEGL
jgi:hypothetical protein